MLTKDALVAAGCVPNPYGWIGDGWLYCAGCTQFRFHRPYSPMGRAVIFEVCETCHTYHGTQTLKGHAA